MTPSWPTDRVTRWSRRILRLASWFVPAGYRREWTLEWEAELWQLRQCGESRRLPAFLIGALAHGLWERREEWKMDSVLGDVRFGVRTLARSPGFTVAAVVMLAIGIGATTALFSVLEEALLARPAYDEPEEIVVVDQMFGREGELPTVSQWSYPRFQAFVADVPSLEDPAGYALRTMTLGEMGAPMVVGVEAVTPSYFSLLGAQAVRGRTFGPDEEDQGAADRVALVSYDFWQTQMGSDPDVVGRTITLDRINLNVLGVMGPDFDGISGGAQFWVPFSALRIIGDETLIEDAWNQHFNVLARLPDGVDIESARLPVQAFGATVMERFPPPAGASEMISSMDLVPYLEARVNPLARTSMLALFGAVVLVLLVATSNLASLLLARGANRMQEAAVRASLGAGRARILRQYLTEGMVLAALGGGFGILAAWVGVDALGTWLSDAVGTGSTRGLEFLDPANLSLDWTVLGFALALTAGVALLFGIFPAWQASRTDPAATLKGGAEAVVSRGVGRLLSGRSALVTLQVGFALVLLVGATLMLRTVANLQSADAGYDPEGMLTAIYPLTLGDRASGIEPATFHTEFLDRVRGMPGVLSATVGEIPGGGPTSRTIVMGSDGRPDLIPEMHVWLRLAPVADGYLTFLGASFIEGRDIERIDGPESDRVIVLNRTAVEELFPDSDPIGQRVRLPWDGYLEVGATVVGIVEDLQFEAPGTQGREIQGYLSLRQSPQLAAGLMVRSSGDPRSLLPAIRSTLGDMNPNIALTSTMTMSERTASITAQPRIVSLLLTVFAVVALLLVAAGLYGIIAYSVARRTRELGLRLSLGADRRSLVGLVVRQGLGVTLIGIAIGLVGAWWTTRFLEGLLFDVQALDAPTFVLVPAVLFVIAAVAGYIPARRATRVSPMVALRTE